MIKTVVFDIGDVLVDADFTRFYMSRGYDEAMAERLKRATIGTPFWKEFDRGILTDEEIIDKMAGCDPQIEKDIRFVCSDLTGLCVRESFAIPWIKELKGRGLQVLFLSNWFKKLYDDSLPALDFLPYTDGGILSYQEQVIKPEPEIYQLLMDRFKIKQGEGVFLDNTLENVEAARREGLLGIHVRSYQQAHSDLNVLINS